MAYRERALTRDEKALAELRLTGPAPAGRETYTIDYFGQDNGGDPDPESSFRLIFQPGSGYMIYVYVVGFGRPGDDRWFHSFWLKDCAVAEVDQEEYGAPDAVHFERAALPLVYSRVGIRAAAIAASSEPHTTQARLRLSDHISSCEFSAQTIAANPARNDTTNETILRIEWRLAGGATLCWDNQDFWRYISPVGETISLVENDRVRFFR